MYSEKFLVMWSAFGNPFKVWCAYVNLEYGILQMTLFVVFPWIAIC